MSTGRLAAIQRAEDTIKHFDTAQDPIRNIAIAVVNTVLPEITDAKQLLGVPEGSILVYESAPGIYRSLTLSGRQLLGLVFGEAAPADPEAVLRRHGKLTVVWMP